MWGKCNDGGAVAVEFALILPVFLFLIFFMLDAGRYLTVQMALNNAAEVGARSIALGQGVSSVARFASGSLGNATVRLATLVPTSDVGSASVEGFICPINSESNQYLDPASGQFVVDPDGNCINLSANQVSCQTALPNYRAMARVSVTFRWITPIGLILQLVDPSLVGPGGSSYFNRNQQDTITIEGKAKLLCQN
ncbi:MAG: TadE-like protein [Actinomycetota bacterium]|jgi:Flp pilus assembly protein TadG